MLCRVQVGRFLPKCALGVIVHLDFFAHLDFLLKEPDSP